MIFKKKYEKILILNLKSFPICQSICIKYFCEQTDENSDKNYEDFMGNLK